MFFNGCMLVFVAETPKSPFCVSSSPLLFCLLLLLFLPWAWPGRAPSVERLENVLSMPDADERPKCQLYTVSIAGYGTEVFCFFSFFLFCGLLACLCLLVLLRWAGMDSDGLGWTGMGMGMGMGEGVGANGGSLCSSAHDGLVKSISFL